MREIFKNRRQKRITYQHLDLRDVYRTHSISLCVLSVPLSLCVRVSVLACVCAVLCVSLLLFDEFFVLFQASLVLIFLVDSSSLPMRLCVHLLRLNLRFLLSNTRTVAALSLLFFSHFPATFRRLSKRLSNDERCARARVCPVVLVLVLVFRAQRRTNEDSRARDEMRLNQTGLSSYKKK